MERSEWKKGSGRERTRARGGEGKGGSGREDW